MKKIMTVISIIIMLSVAMSYATVSMAKNVPSKKVTPKEITPDVKPRPIPEIPETMTPKEIYETMKTFVKDIHILGGGLAQSINVMNDSLDKKEANAETRAEKIALVQLTRVAEMHFSQYTLIKLGMTMNHKKDVMMMFAVAYSTVNKINKLHMIYALESAKEYATLSNSKEMVEFISAATEVSNEISGIYKLVFKLFSKVMGKYMQPKEFNAPKGYKI